MEYCYVLPKFAQAPLRLDRIVIQLFVMLAHYLQVFLLLFLVQKEQSLSQAIFGIQNLRQTALAIHDCRRKWSTGGQESAGK